MRQNGCVQCAHYGLRIGSFINWTRSDWLCFRGGPVFAGEGMQFESHLGHSITPRQRGFCFDVCTLTRIRVPLTLVAAGAWLPRWPVRLCGWRGQVPWLMVPPAAGMWGHSGLLSGLLGLTRLVLHLFMPHRSVDDMTCGEFLKIISPDTLSTGEPGESWCRIVGPKGVCTLSTPVHRPELSSVWPSQGTGLLRNRPTQRSHGRGGIAIKAFRV